jgi:N utilization substance protein B
MIMSASQQNAKAPKRTSAHGRSTARLAAVQALYQMDMAGTDLNEVIEEFRKHRLGRELDGEQYAVADARFFRDLLEGVVEQQRTLDPMLNDSLAEGWRLSRIDSILRAILRAGAYELLRRDDVPAKTVITEYIDITHAFFQGDEPKAVNGILDTLAHLLRTKEFEPEKNV